jgi:hypothetical protein
MVCNLIVVPAKGRLTANTTGNTRDEIMGEPENTPAEIKSGFTNSLKQNNANGKDAPLMIQTCLYSIT